MWRKPGIHSFIKNMSKITRKNQQIDRNKWVDKESRTGRSETRKKIEDGLEALRLDAFLDLVICGRQPSRPSSLPFALSLSSQHSFWSLKDGPDKFQSLGDPIISYLHIVWYFQRKMVSGRFRLPWVVLEWFEKVRPMSCTSPQGITDIRDVYDGPKSKITSRGMVHWHKNRLNRVKMAFR